MSCTSSNAESPWMFDQPASSRNTNPDASASFNSLFFAPEALRFHGDGLDFRRPAMSGLQQNVIDLTEDSSPVEHRVHLDQDSASPPASSRATRPPRFPQHIIDLDEQEDTSYPAVVRDGSPEIEFVSSRPLPFTTRDRSQSAGRHHGRWNGEPGLNTRPPESNRNRSAGARFDLRNQVSRVQESLRHLPRMNPSNALLRRDIDVDAFFINTSHNTLLPGELEYSTQGFLMGDVARPPPPPPTYDAPSPPRAGFTRSPREEDVLVCPNCEEELGMGEDEFKRQVWVIKSCGHVCPIIIRLYYQC